MIETAIQFVIYAVRWQMSTFILAPVIHYGQKRGWSATTCAAVANLIGAVVFFPVDKYITFGIATWLRKIGVGV